MAGLDGQLVMRERGTVRALDIPRLTGAGDLHGPAAGRCLYTRAATTSAIADPRAQPDPDESTAPPPRTAHDDRYPDRDLEESPEQPTPQLIGHAEILAIQQRARWSRWLPHLVAEVSWAHRSREGDAALAETSRQVTTVALWIRLTWNIDTGSHDLQTLQRSLP